jgi:hypothetical protein
MGRMLATILFLFVSGCSCAPVADFLDWVNPSPVRPQATNPATVVPAAQPPVPPSIVVQPPEAPPPVPPPTTANRPPAETSRSERPAMPPLTEIPSTR